MYEVYLPPFRAAMQAGVQSIMASFNEIGGVPMHANSELTKGVLREQWGFDGILLSDYTGVHELIEHGVAANPRAAGALALSAGIDIDMASSIYLHDMPEVVRTGRLPESSVDAAVRRVLRAKPTTGAPCWAAGLPQAELRT